MLAEPRSYRFGPASIAGAFGSPFSWLQVASLGAGLYLAYRVFVIHNPFAVPVAVAIVLAAMVVTFAPIGGRELIEWAPIALMASLRRILGRHRAVSDAPTTGFVGTPQDPQAAGEPPAPWRPPGLSNVEIIGASFDRQTVGVIRDNAQKTYAAVLKVRVAAFGLLSSDDQQRRVDAWSALLTNLCREGTPISRMQWVERTIPTDPDELVRYHLAARDERLEKQSSVVQSYETLIDDSTAATQDHELFLTVQISTKRAKGLIRRLASDLDEGACLLLQQELETIAEALVACDIEPVGVLRPRTLAKHIRLAYDPFQRRALDRLGAIDPDQDGVAQHNAWPVASRAEWEHYQTDGALHATYWIAESPRRDVPAAFLLPLLLQANMQRSISVVMEPLETSRALSKVEAAIVGNQTSEQVRHSKGFAQTARRAKHSTDLVRRESELASGYGEFRYAGYVTVSARDEVELEHACASMENRALQSRLQVRRLNGLHETAFSYTLPLGRGLSQGASIVIDLLLSLTKRFEHRVTTAHLGAIYPFVAQGGLGGRGVLVGYDQSGGAFCYDPWIQYGHTLTNPNMIVIGIVGRAKSSLVKTYLYRQANFGRQHWIVDPKGEYAPLAHALGCTPITLTPGGGVRLNPLSSHAGAHSQLRLLVAVAAAAIGRPLTPTESMICAETLATFQAPGEPEPTLPRVVERLLDPQDVVADAMRASRAELLDASKDLAYGLARLCRGDLAGMFDGETSDGIDLDGMSVVLDLHHVQDSAAIGIIMICAAAWLTAAIAREATLDGADQRNRIIVVDEAWRVLSNLACAEWLQDSFKHSRSYGVQNIVVTHRISDLTSAGDDGTRIARLAQGLLADAETKVIYAQDKAELETAERLLGLTDTQTSELPNLSRGLALWLVGDRSFLVRHVLTEHELTIVDTDARMRAHQIRDEDRAEAA